MLLMHMPFALHAQSFDVGTVEALISDHKRVSSVLVARSGIEQANVLLHDYSQAAAVDYDSLNVKLDKYTKCFDIIDVIYNSGMTVFNVWNTKNDVSERISQLEVLIGDFVSDYTLRGNILSSDSIIIGACRRAVSQVAADCSSLVNSLVELAQYASGLRHMTTAQLLTVIGEINDNLDSIRDSVDHAYFVIWKYISVRTHYFKRSLYNSKTMREMCNSAFSRWRSVTKEVGY